MFNRWRNRTSEAENYLRATDTVSRPIAFMMTLAGLIIVAALLFMVFLGGRWAYTSIRERANVDNVATTDQQQATDGEEQDQLPIVTEENAEESAPQATPPPTATTPPTTTPTPTSPGTTTTTAPAPTPTPTNTNVPTAQSIPDTGPGQVLASVVLVFVAFTIGHQVYVRSYAALSK